MWFSPSLTFDLHLEEQHRSSAWVKEIQLAICVALDAIAHCLQR